jgi:GNAT superfamily N-acetyltransferase
MRSEVRAATRADVEPIHALIVALATYERAAHEVIATPADLERALFGQTPRVFALVAELDGSVVGFALWFTTYSTWVGRHGIWLEDLFVLPEHRGHGLGKALLVELARLCVENGCGRLEWNVLDWNEPALGFYRSLGALPLEEWTVHRLSGQTLRALADQRTAARKAR